MIRKGRNRQAIQNNSTHTMRDIIGRRTMWFEKDEKSDFAATMPTHGQPRTSDASGQQQQPAQHALTQTSTALSVIQYPAGLKLFLIMLSVLVSMFLVALVMNLPLCILSVSFFYRVRKNAYNPQGPSCHCNRSPSDHRPFPLCHRYWLVRQRLLAHNLRIPAALWQILRLFPH